MNSHTRLLEDTSMKKLIYLKKSLNPFVAQGSCITSIPEKAKEIKIKSKVGLCNKDKKAS